MDLTSFTSGLKTGSLIKNPVGDLTSGLQAKFSALDTTGLSPESVLSISTTMSTLDAQKAVMAENVAALQTRLPLMKAVDEIDLKSKISQGVVPASDGGTGVKSLIAGITGIKEKMQVLSTSLTASLSAAVSGGIGALESALASASTSVNDHAAEVTAQSANAAAVMTDSVANLKAFAFAKFVAMPQPPHIRNLLNEVVPPASVPNIDLIKLDEKSSRVVSRNRFTEAYVPSMPNSGRMEETPTPPLVNSSVDKPPPMINGQTHDAFKIKFFTYYGTLVDARNAASSKANASVKVAKDYRDTTWPNYPQVKEKAQNGDAQDRIVYNEMKASYANSSAYIKATEDTAEFEKIKANCLRVGELWTAWTIREYANVPDGPPW